MEPILTYLAKSSAILGLFYLIYTIFLEKETFFEANRIFLISGVFTAFTLPFVSLTKTVFLEPLSAFTEPLPATELLSHTSVVPAYGVTINWLYIFGLLYVFGMLFMFVKFVIQLVSVLRIIKKYPHKTHNGISYIKTDKEQTPFSFFKYIVYNPKLFTKEELQIILKHEKAHSRDRHSIDIIIIKFTQILQWINPFVWWYQKAIIQNLEYLADKKATTEMDCRKSYQLTLLKVTNCNPVPITTNFFNSLIKKRILMLKQQKSKNRNMLKMALIGPLLMAFVLIFNTKSIAQIKPLSSEASKVAKVSEVPEVPEVPKAPEESALAVMPDVPQPPKVSANLIDQDRIKIKIHKSTTRADLEAIQQQLQNEGINFKFRKLKFNSNNELTSITVSAKDNKGSSERYAISSDEPIAPFYIIVHDGAFNISGHKVKKTIVKTVGEAINKDKTNVFVLKTDKDAQDSTNEIVAEVVGDEDNVFILNGKTIDLADLGIEIETLNELINETNLSFDIDDDHQMMTINGKTIDIEALKDKANKIKIRVENEFIDSEKDSNDHLKKHVFSWSSNSNDDENVFVFKDSKIHESQEFAFVDDPEIEKLIIIDGDEADFETLDTLAKERKLDDVNILKPKIAVSIYGQKAKDGAIIAITKK